MAIPTTVETAMRNYFIPHLVDQVFHYTYLLERLWDDHVVQTGGPGFDQPLAYGKNDNVGTYNKYAEFRREPGDPLTKSVVSWADYYVAIPFSKKELRENKGQHGKLIDLAQAYIDLGEKSLKERLAYDLFGTGAAYEWPAGSGDTLAPLTGLQAICAVDRTYGGIDSTTYTWWDAQVNAVSGSPTWTNIVTSSHAAYLPKQMRYTLGLTNDGSDEVTVIVCPRLIWEALATIADTKEKFEKIRVGQGKNRPGTEANMGFTAIMFDDVPVVWDRYCPAGKMFLLNEDHLHMRTLAGADLTYQGVEDIPGSDVELATILLSTNINTSKCAAHGIISGLPTAYS